VASGDPASTSLMPLECTVTVQVVPAGRLLVGVSVNELAGDELVLNGIGVPVGHSMLNALPVAFTDSLKLIVIPVPVLTSVAPSAGLVEVTAGGRSVANENTKFEFIGVPLEASVTWAATTVTVQVTPSGSAEFGVSV
jgi:hypothetical protein